MVAVAEGTSTATVSYNGHVTAATVSYVSYVGATADTFFSLDPASLGAHATAQIESRWGMDKNIYTTQNFTAHTYVRNPNCWLNQFSNATAISPWNSVGGKNMGGVLIAPDTMLISSHYGPISAGKTVKFVKADNTVVTMTVAACTPGPTIWTPDFRVVTFTEDVPAGIAFCKCLPADWRTKITTTAGIPLWQTDQEEKALAVHWYMESTSSNATAPTDQCVIYYETWISGDSGSPRGICINGELVLLTVATYGGAGSGSSLDDYRDWVNAQMTANGSPYQLTPIDLSMFPSY
jgi:hypothetical protein